MDTDSRQDRQLMRQRGAGTRSINSAGFGITFDDAPANSRHERQLMRQRGAGTRTINAVDFGIAFPTPNRTRRSTTRTPQPPSAGSRRSKTPARRSREPSAALSVGGNSINKRRQSIKRPNVYEIPEEDDANATLSVSKRRKLSHDASTPATLVPRSSIQRIPSNNRRKTRASNIIIAEDEDADERYQANSPAVTVDLEQELSHKGSNTFDEADKENAGPSEPKSQVNRKKRKSIGQQSFRKKKRSSTGSLQESAAPLVEGNSHSTPLADKGELNVQPVLVEQTTSSSPPLRPTTESKKKRKKRKPVVLGRKRRRSSEQVVLASSIVAAENSVVDDAPERTDNAEDEVAEQSERESVASVPRKRSKLFGRNRPFFRRQRLRSPASDAIEFTPARPAFEADEKEDETYVDEDHSPEPVTPAVIRKPKRGKSRAQKQNQTSGGSKKTTITTFPIVTQRMTNTGALPTIAEETKGTDSEDDLSLASTRFPDRPPNAVDVLAQICRESIATAVSKVEASVDTGRAETRRKRSALQAFGAQLDGRLFEMSEAVEDRLTLEARVKRAKRERMEMEKEWIEVRKQREEVALWGDKIRRMHWHGEKESKEKAELSEMLYGVEMAVEREGVDRAQEEGLEFLLKRVAGQVSGGDESGQGGLLERLRDFNGVLERTAAVLEGRGG